jgi:hypothetical protein
MPSLARPLPKGYEHLERFSEWSVSSDSERIAMRLDTPFPQVVEFYDAVMPSVKDAMAYLATRSVDNPTLEDVNLVNLLKAMAEIANAVEIYHQGSIPDAGDLRLYVSSIPRDLAGSDVNE